jgi:hypothetical protein
LGLIAIILFALYALVMIFTITLRPVDEAVDRDQTPDRAPD